VATDDLNDIVLKAVADAYARGFEAGKDSARKTLMHAVEAAFSGQTSDPDAVLHMEAGAAVEIADNEDEGSARAPRGLTERVVHQIVSTNLPITTEEIQRQATELDDRINPKTVYNVLYRSAHRYYRDERARWRLKGVPQQTQIFDTAEDRGLEDMPIAAS
jgi:hypothetical protein